MYYRVRCLGGTIWEIAGKTYALIYKALGSPVDMVKYVSIREVGELLETDEWITDLTATDEILKPPISRLCPDH